LKFIAVYDKSTAIKLWLD